MALNLPQLIAMPEFGSYGLQQYSLWGSQNRASLQRLDFQGLCPKEMLQNCN